MERYEADVYLGVPQADGRGIRTATIPRYSGSKKRAGANLKFKKWRGTSDTLDERVFLTAEYIVSHKNYGKSFTAEAIAYMINVRVDQVRHSLHRLNQAGKVSQACREFAHDTNRARLFGGPAHGWAANSYYIYR